MPRAGTSPAWRRPWERAPQQVTWRHQSAVSTGLAVGSESFLPWLKLTRNGRREIFVKKLKEFFTVQGWL